MDGRRVLEASVLEARHRSRVATPRLRDGEMRLRDGEMGLGLRTRPGRRAPSRGGPGRGVVRRRGADPAGAPAAEARVSKAAEERRGGEWVGGWEGFGRFHIPHPRCAPAVGGRMTLTNLPLGQWRVGPNLVGPTRQPLKCGFSCRTEVWAERGWVGCREGQTGGPSFEMRLEWYGVWLWTNPYLKCTWMKNKLKRNL
jgi:hypothetical protein